MRFIRKLETFSPLSEADKHLIASVTRIAEVVEANRYLVLEGDKPCEIRLIESGFAFRYKSLERRRRQIVGYLFPGDVGDFHASLLPTIDHGIGTLTAVSVVRISQSNMNALLDRPAIARALLLVELANESISRDWLANIGGHCAEQRLAHLLCEWHLRLQLVGLAEGDKCDLPLTQIQLSETLGITPIHVSRTLKSLRLRGLIRLEKRCLTILNAAGLRKLGSFTEAYLHAQNF